MREAIKVSVLGGSGVYTPGLIIALLSRINELPRINLVLCGRTEEKLNKILKVADVLLKDKKDKIKVVSTTDFEKGIEGSDIVINQIRVGGFSARAKDEEFAREMGIVEEETMGIVGLANSIRTIPVVLKYAAIVEKRAPDAYFLNFTNPASMVIRALTLKTKLKVFGVCDLPEVITHRIASILNFNRNDLYFKYSGLNHLGWVYDVLKNGKTVLKGILDKSDRFKDLGIKKEYIDIAKAIPVPFLKFYYDPEEQIEKFKNKGLTRGEELLRLEDMLLSSYSEINESASPDEIKTLLFKSRRPVWYEYSVVPVLVSLFGKSGNVHIIMHKNDGVIDFLDKDDIIESNAYIDRMGIKMIKDGDLPVEVQGLIKSVALYERYSVEAVFNPTERNLIKALVMHPLVPSLKVVKKSIKYLREQRK